MASRRHRSYWWICCVSVQCLPFPIALLVTYFLAAAFFGAMVFDRSLNVRNMRSPGVLLRVEEEHAGRRKKLVKVAACLLEVRIKIFCMNTEVSSPNPPVPHLGMTGGKGDINR